MSSGSSNGSSSSKPFSPISTTFHPMDPVTPSNKTPPFSPVFSTSPLSSPKIRRSSHSPLPRTGSDSYPYSQQSPKQSPHTPRRQSPSRYDRSPRGSISYVERSISPSRTAVSFDPPPLAPSLHSPNLLSPYDSTQRGRRSPRPDRSPSPLSFNRPMSNTLPRNFACVRQPGKWLSSVLILLVINQMFVLLNMVFRYGMSREQPILVLVLLCYLL